MSKSYTIRTIRDIVMMDLSDESWAVFKAELLVGLDQLRLARRTCDKIGLGHRHRASLTWIDDRSGDVSLTVGWEGGPQAVFRGKMPGPPNTP